MMRLGEAKDKLLDRALKLLKKAVSEKQTRLELKRMLCCACWLSRRGVPECTKAMRKGQKGICFLVWASSNHSRRVLRQPTSIRWQLALGMYLKRVVLVHR